MADQMAIVGAACRFPASPDLQTYWTLLAGEGDAIREASEERWPEPRRPTVASGGFLDAITDFDASAFSMSPVQAAETDPQQRLMLEVALEALEDARLGPPDLQAHDVGVYIGIGASEYDARFIAPGREVRGLHSGLGNDSSFAAGRIASLLGLRGPALAINTACSSALVAIHTALGDLRAGRCPIAVVGAVNLLVVPENSSRLERMGVLAPDGRCKPFDRAADGYGRAEGAGAVVLATRETADRLGLRTRAWLAGAAVNQDAGETGLTAPNPRAQMAVIAAALDDAGLEPEAIDVIEAHGTGTPTGDPVEIEALGEAFAAREHPLPVGSAKSTVGHLEVAAGMAGLLKAIGMLESGRPLPHRTHGTPISLPRPLCLAGSGLATESARAPGAIGISAFGLSGTNAHVVLTRAEPRDIVREEADGPTVLVASASGAQALRTLAGRLAEQLDHAPSALHAIADASRRTRRPLTHRLAMVVDDAVRARDALELFAADGTLPADAPATTGEAHAPPTLTLLVGSLQGDWAPLVERLRGWPAFADAIAGASDDALGIAAAAGIAALWRSLGLSFDRVEGLGEGQRAAAVIRGDCALADAASLDTGAEPSSTTSDDELVFAIGSGPGGAAFVAGPSLTEEAALRAVANAWCRGGLVDWPVVHPEGLRAALPPTPWERTRAWIDDDAPTVETPAPVEPASTRSTRPHFRRTWRALEGLRERTTRRRWVIVADHRGVTPALAQALTPSPRILCLRNPGSGDPPIDGAIAVDASAPETWAAALGDLDDVAGLLFLAGLDQRPCFDGAGAPRPEAADDAVRATWLAARWARVVLEASPPKRAPHERMRFLLASRGAVACAPEEVVDPTQAALWGLGATLALEHPELGVGTVDLDPTGELGGLVALLGVTLPEDQVALRGEGARAARLAPGEPGPAPTWGPGPVLLTGGLGALGLQVAEALADHGTQTIWLAGRRPPGPDAQQRIDGLRARGATVETFALDVADADQVRGFADRHAPTGWVHLAGVLDDGIALHLTPESTLTPMRPKVHGTLALAAALDREVLRTVAFGSSVAGLLGSMGQANYAAANTWLDAFAEAWQARGCHAVSVALGPLSGGGMAVPHLDRLAKAGIRALPLDEAAHAVLSASPGPSPVAVVDLDLPSLGRSRRVRPVLQDLAESRTTTPEPAPAPQWDRATLLDWITTRVAQDLGLDPDALDPRRPLAWHGFDSLMAIELKRALDAELGTSLPSGPFLSGPSLEELVAALAPLVEVTARTPPRAAVPTFGSVPRLTALQPAGTGPGLPAVRLQSPAVDAAPLPLPVQIGLAAMVAVALGLAWGLA